MVRRLAILCTVVLLCGGFLYSSGGRSWKQVQSFSVQVTSTADSKASWHAVDMLKTVLEERLAGELSAAKQVQHGGQVAYTLEIQHYRDPADGFSVDNGDDADPKEAALRVVVTYCNVHAPAQEAFAQKVFTSQHTHIIPAIEDLVDAVVEASLFAW